MIGQTVKGTPCSGFYTNNYGNNNFRLQKRSKRLIDENYEPADVLSKEFKNYSRTYL
jgi:hypothetical protein